MALNYLEERIPSIETLQKKAEEVLNSVSIREKYAFNELFQRQDSGEYYRNNVLFNEVGYNTKSKKERKENNEIKGIYLFFEDNIPVYVGISRGILRRLKNHFLGKSHFDASLAYLIARDKYDKEIEVYMGERSKFPFDKYVPAIQSEMIENWTISIIPTLDSYEMYFIEFYLACELKTKWNTFETH